MEENCRCVAIKRIDLDLYNLLKKNIPSNIKPEDYSPSTNWVQCGHLIERYIIEFSIDISKGSYLCLSCFADGKITGIGESFDFKKAVCLSVIDLFKQ